MAKFRWPLQRLLDVKIQREIAARNELFRLSRELAKLRQEIIRRRSGIRTMLEELAACEFERRLPRQESVIRSCVVDEEQIRKLEAQLRDLEVQRSKKMEQFLALKRSRETLEKLREEARQRFLHEQLQIEQKQLDEASQIAYARKKLRRHASGAA